MNEDEFDAPPDEMRPAPEPAGSAEPETGAEPQDMAEVDGDMQPASPEEQQIYNQFVGRAMLMIYDDKMLPKVIDMLDGGAEKGQDGDPMEGLARTTALVVGRVAQAADKAGQKLPGDVLLHAGKEILEDLAELSRVAKIKDYSEDPDALEGAMFRALDQFRLILQGAGRLDQRAAQTDMAKLEEMDKSGELETMLRGLAAKDANAPASKSNKGQPKGLNVGMR